MALNRRKLAAVIAERTLKGGASKAYLRQLAALLLTERRTGDLESILRDVQSDWAAAGYVEVIATSAHPLTAKLRADIKAHVKRLYPKAKRLTVTEVYDPAIIGGVRLSLPGRQLDLSVEAKLNKFKQSVVAGKD